MCKAKMVHYVKMMHADRPARPWLSNLACMSVVSTIFTFHLRSLPQVGQVSNTAVSILMCLSRVGNSLYVLVELSLQEKGFNTREHSLLSPLGFRLLDLFRTSRDFFLGLHG